MKQRKTNKGLKVEDKNVPVAPDTMGCVYFICENDYKEFNLNNSRNLLA